MVAVKPKQITFVALVLALVVSTAVGVWGLMTGGSPLVVMPLLAQGMALAAVGLGLDRTATLTIIGMATVATLIVVVVALPSVGWWLAPAVVLDVLAFVVVWLRTKPVQAS